MADAVAVPDAISRALCAFGEDDERHWQVQAFLFNLLAHKALSQADAIRRRVRTPTPTTDGGNVSLRDRMGDPNPPINLSGGSPPAGELPDSATTATRRSPFYVQGFCPMGCGQMLVVGGEGRIACSHTNCPRPEAVNDLLRDRETEHIVQLGTRDFTIRHPLRERLDDALMTCSLHQYISILAAPPGKPGLYRARHRLNGGWNWERLPADPTADSVEADRG